MDLTCARKLKVTTNESKVFAVVRPRLSLTQGQKYRNSLIFRCFRQYCHNAGQLKVKTTESKVFALVLSMRSSAQGQNDRNHFIFRCLRLYCHNASQLKAKTNEITLFSKTFDSIVYALVSSKPKLPKTLYFQVLSIVLSMRWLAQSPNYRKLRL